MSEQQQFIESIYKNQLKIEIYNLLANNENLVYIKHFLNMDVIKKIDRKMVKMFIDKIDELKDYSRTDKKLYENIFVDLMEDFNDINKIKEFVTLLRHYND